MISILMMKKIVKNFEIKYILLIVKVENTAVVSILSFNHRNMDSSKTNKELYNYFGKNRK